MMHNLLMHKHLTESLQFRELLVLQTPATFNCIRDLHSQEQLPAFAAAAASSPCSPAPGEAAAAAAHPRAPGAQEKQLGGSESQHWAQLLGKQSLSFQQFMKPDREKCELGPMGKGEFVAVIPAPRSPPFALLTHPSASLTSWENSCAVGREERLESGALTGRLCCDTEMLLGCTMMLMHCPMLSAKRCGSSALSQLSRGEHLGSTQQCTSSAYSSAHQCTELQDEQSLG